MSILAKVVNSNQSKNVHHSSKARSPHSEHLRGSHPKCKNAKVETDFGRAVEAGLDRFILKHDDDEPLPKERGALGASFAACLGKLLLGPVQPQNRWEMRSNLCGFAMLQNLSLTREK